MSRTLLLIGVLLVAGSGGHAHADRGRLVAAEGSANASGRSRGAYSGPSSHVAMPAILGGCPAPRLPSNRERAAGGTTGPGCRR